MHVEQSVDVMRSAQEVFDYVSDVGNYPEWMAHVLDVEKDTAGPPQQSDRFVVTIKSVGRRFETPFERVSYERGRGVTDRAVGGPVPNQKWHSALLEVPGGTRVTRAVDVDSAGLLKLLEPLQKWTAGRQLRKDLARLKGVVETR